jgi:phage tail sheath protein FI
VAHCERRRDRFALLDAPWSASSQLGLSASGLRAWRSRFDSAFAALHAPWLKVVDPRRGARRSLVRAVPPCGHIAGIMAATDLRLGVHASAANQPLQWLQDVSLSFDDERHGLLNDLHVNLVRAVPGRGLRLLGARTLSLDPDWRFVNVRRLMSMVARAIEIAIQWAVFEPNDWRTRMKLQLAIGSFLRSLWVRGALQGAVAEEAFYVRCDETNNPSPSRDLGRLLIDVGLAPVVPMEFIVLRIGRDAGGFAIAEAGAA